MPLSARVSLAAQRTIRDAFKELEQTVSPNDRRDFAEATLDKVRQATHEIEDHLAARQSLRNMRRLLPLFAGLEHYSKSIEVLCNGTPYLPWIWAPITLILKIASDYIEAFDKIIKAYSRIAEPLARFKLLDRAYGKDVNFQPVLAVFYVDILKFHQEAYKFVRRSGWKLLFMTSWGRFERRFDGILADLKAHEDLVDKTASAVTASEVRMLRDNLETAGQETLDKFAREEEQRTASQYAAIVGCLKMDESEQLTIADLIASEATSYPGTCSWILKQPKVASWMRYSHEASFLVLHGHPGTGKSVLATQIAAFLQSAKRSDSLVVSHFCTQLYTASTEFELMLRSLLVQLIRPAGDLIAHVHDELVIKRRPATRQLLEQLLRHVVGAAAPLPSQTSYIHLILDGLNECDDDRQAKVMNMLERLVSATSSGSTVCKVLVLSRLTKIISKMSKHKQVASLSDEKEHTAKAIADYAIQRLGALRSLFFQMGISDVDMRDMGHRIANKADGMFLWARLVLEYLSSNILHSKAEVLEAVHRLPRKLSEFYGQVLGHVLSRFDERSVQRMRLMLGWIAFAKRPLRNVEFRSAISFSGGDPSSVELPPPCIFDMCGPLIEKRPDSTFAFIHGSVKDFLQSKDNTLLRLNEQAALYEHGLASAACLLRGLHTLSPALSSRCPETDASPLLQVLRGFHGFHVYATEYWVEYLLAAAATTESHGLDTSSQFFAVSSVLAKQLLANHSLVAPGAPSGSDDDGVGDDSNNGPAPLLDARLPYLEPFAELHVVAKAVLKERSLTFLDSGRTTCNTGLGDLLTRYQDVVQTLLVSPTCQGASLEELQKFRLDFRWAAYTCRLWSCPWAGRGFTSDELRRAHELGHTRRVPCTVPGCQYPPLPSLQAQRAHIRNVHEARPAARTRIRTTEPADRGERVRERGDRESAKGNRPWHKSGIRDNMLGPPRTGQVDAGLLNHSSAPAVTIAHNTPRLTNTSIPPPPFLKAPKRSNPPLSLVAPKRVLGIFESSPVEREEEGEGDGDARTERSQFVTPEVPDISQDSPDFFEGY